MNLQELENEMKSQEEREKCKSMNMVKTLCNSCVFFNYYDKPICFMDNRVDKFFELGQAEEDEKGNVTINRLCNTCRNQETVDKRYKGLSIQEVKNKTREFVIPTVDYIILVDKSNCKDELDNTITKIRQSTILPSKVFFGIVGDDVNAKSVYKTSRNLTDRIKNVYVVNLFKKDPSRIEVLDDCIKKSTAMFTSIFVSGYDIPSDFIEQIDQIVNENLIQLPLITNSDGTINGTVILRTIFDYFQTFDGLVDMVKQELLKTNKQEIVWNQK